MVGDMDIHASISKDFIQKHQKSIQSSPITVFDANLEISTIQCILEICRDNNKPGM